MRNRRNWKGTEHNFSEIQSTSTGMIPVLYSFLIVSSVTYLLSTPSCRLPNTEQWLKFPHYRGVNQTRRTIAKRVKEHIEKEIKENLFISSTKRRRNIPLKDQQGFSCHERCSPAETIFLWGIIVDLTTDVCRSRAQSKHRWLRSRCHKSARGLLTKRTRNRWTAGAMTHACSRLVKQSATGELATPKIIRNAGGRLVTRVQK